MNRQTGQLRTARSLIAGFALALAASSCSEQGPTASSSQTPNQAPSFAPARWNGPLATTLTNFVVTNAAGVAGVFNGTLTVTSFATNAAGDLLANGTLVGTTAIGGVTQDVSTTFASLQVIPADACNILSLDVGPIFLDLLGLIVQTNEIILNIAADPGPGNLLGNLLCAVVHLLDGNPLGNAVTNLLNIINAILAGL
jgi:hypothetical protein